MDTVNKGPGIPKGSASCSLQHFYPKLDAQKPRQTTTYVVLSTPELLCNIICQLPLADIVTTTGVCLFWRNVVAANLHLQRALFFEPEEIRRGLFFLVNDSWWDEFLSEVKSGDAIGDVTNWHICHTVGRVHPFLARICNTWFDIRGSVENVLNIGTAPHFNHPDGSWRRMFITQPPCNFVMVMAETVDRTDTERFTVRYGDHDGVRLGGLYDAMVAGWSTDSSKKFHVMASIPAYSKQGTENEETTMEIDIKDGTGYWPDEAAWTDTTLIKYVADLRNQRSSKQ